MGTCVDVGDTKVTQISITEPSIESSVNAPIIMFSANEGLLPVKSEVEDKIMVQMVPVLHDKSNNSNINRKSDSISMKRSNEQTLRLTGDEKQDSDDDIVIINEVRNEPHIIGGPKRAKRSAEPVMITRFLASEAETKPSIKRKFSDKRLRSQTRSNSDEIIVKKIK
jgi:hypothetical protein